MKPSSDISTFRAIVKDIQNEHFIVSEIPARLMYEFEYKKILALLQERHEMIEE